MATRKGWRPPLKFSLSLPSDVDEESVLQGSRRKKTVRKESFQSSLTAPTEDEENLQLDVDGACQRVTSPSDTNSEFQTENYPDFGLKNGDLDTAHDGTSSAMNWRVVRALTKQVKDKLLYIKSPLIRAILEGNVEAIESTFDTNLCLEDDEGYLPLHHACEEGKPDVIKALIRLGCDVRAYNSNRLSLLHVASRYGRYEAVSLLLEEGVTPDVREKVGGRTAVHEATLSPDIRVLNVMIEKLKEDPWEAQRILRIGDKDGRTALHLAAYRSLPEAIDLLLSAGADVASIDNEGLTPMHANLLSHRGKRRCGGVLTQLLEAGGDVEVISGAEEEKLVHYAARAGCSKCLNFLYQKGTCLESKNRFGQTPLHIAASENQSDAAEYLVKNGANLEAIDIRGLRPMHLAVLNDSVEVLEKLIESGVDREVEDKDGWTYIQLALLRRKTKAFETLVKCGAVKLPEEAGESVLHYCAALGFINAVTFLLDEGWDINIRDAKGRTALHRSLNHGHENIATMLINRDAGLHEIDDTGATPLHYAVRWGGSDAILRLLMKKKAKLGVRDRLGRTPLHYAASKFSIMSDLYILLDCGSALDCQDNMGLTPLHLAARLGNESLVRILLDNGAKHDLKDVYDFLPMDHAKEKNHKSIIKRLQAHDIKLHPEKEQKLAKNKEEEEEREAYSRLEQHRKSVSW